VERVKRGATRFPAFMSAGAADRPALTRAAARGSARELAGLGFTTVFAPSADVTTGADDPTIGSRSAGSDPQLVARQVIAAADGISSAGVMPVLKHFPGHGSVPADSHEELPVQVRSRAALTNTDLAPFQHAIDIRVPAIMVGHIDVRAVDPGTPSSLSMKVITGLLRQRMGFDGLVITDALDMAAVQEEYGAAKAAVRSLQAGADVLLMPADVRAARDGIVAAVKSGQLKRSRLEEAAARLLAHLIHQAAQRSQPAEAGSQAKSSQALSAAAVTVVAGPCSGNLVPEGIHVTGSPDRVTRLQSAARAAGVPLGRGKRVALVGFGADVPAGADIVVATDSPYVLGRSSAPVRIATYGDTPGAMKALIGVLTGKATAPGKLPVAVSGVARTGC
ncbi:MAG TPA: glycoside hydrolase family 3 N-terminal domain-containing protein, partial [Nocardioides sp.]